MQRNLYIITLLLLALSGTAQAAKIPELENLPADLETMQQRQVPMLVFFHASYCHYCHEVEASFLEPLSRNADYAARTLFRRVGLDTGRSLIDSEGDKVRDRAFARTFGIELAPTLVFLGPDGTQLGRAVVGVADYDLYGGQIDRALRTAESCIEDPMLPQCQP
ncbi:MAG: thioredoxin family protein [Halothiobacillaceae bacterium]